MLGRKIRLWPAHVEMNIQIKRLDGCTRVSRTPLNPVTESCGQVSRGFQCRVFSASISRGREGFRADRSLAKSTQNYSLELN